MSNPDGWIVSKAHEWACSLPLSENGLLCLRCNATTKIGEFDVPRCVPHYESSTSGFIDES